MSDWLAAESTPYAATEPTGLLRKPVWNMKGRCTPRRVNPREHKQVSGRKSDIRDRLASGYRPVHISEARGEKPPVEVPAPSA